MILLIPDNTGIKLNKQCVTMRYDNWKVEKHNFGMFSGLAKPISHPCLFNCLLNTDLHLSLILTAIGKQTFHDECTRDNKNTPKLSGSYYLKGVFSYSICF